MHPLLPTLTAHFTQLKDLHRIVVAVSGGVDSMVLLWALKQWRTQNAPKLQIIAATVDHALREGSAQEAEFVARWCEGQGIPHTIIKWQHEIAPSTKLMERARMMRYELLAQFAHTHDAPVIVTAHHGDDQIETFIMRLMRGSGLSGLVSMREWRTLHSNIKVFRPFLDVSKAHLKTIAQDIGITSVEDPSNDNPHFERVRVRQALEALNLKDSDLLVTLSRLQRAEAALEHITNAFLTYIHIKDGERYMQRELYDEAPQEVQIRVLMRLLHVDPALYPPSLEAVERLHAELTAQPKETVRRTLAGYVITFSPKWVKLLPEYGDRRQGG